MIYSKEQLKEMNVQERWCINDACELIKSKIKGYEWNDDIKELDERIDTATTQEECQKYACRMIWEKQIDILLEVEQRIKNLSVLDIRDYLIHSEEQ